MMKSISTCLVFLMISSSVTCFSPVQTTNTQQRLTSVASSSSSSSSLFLSSKGFGSTPEKNIKKKEKSTGQVKREQEANKYDEVAAAGGQEYSVFVRQFGSTDQSWLPCGSVAVPRGAQVSDAIYANDEALRKAIVRTYKKLAGFENEFEFGFNLKVYPDDPIEVAKKNLNPRQSGISVGNWISTLLSPVDASNVKRPDIQ